MSFDLFFCRENGERPSDDEIARACGKHPACRHPDDAPAGFWLYENEATGVYFTLEREAWITEEDDAPEMMLKPPFVDAEMHAIINFIRPSFFGIEAMGIIAEMCRDLDLFVLDSQTEDDEGRIVPERLNATELEERWLLSNDLTFRTAATNTGVHHWSRARAQEWHRYQFCRQMIDEELLAAGRSVFVPNLMLVVPAGEESATVQSMVVWSESIPFVFPRCDLVLIRRKRKTFLGGLKDEWGLVPRSFVDEQIGSLLRPLETEWGTFDHLPENHMASAAAIVAKWKLDVPKESVERISPDSFVDDLE